MGDKMIDGRKQCNECKFLYASTGHFGNPNGICLAIENKFTINKQMYDEVEAYWKKKLRHNQVMETTCPAFNAEAL